MKDDLALEPSPPIHWTEIIAAKDRKDDEFIISKYQPVFTFSTMAAVRYGFFPIPYDCYGILTTAEKYKDWKLKVHETEIVDWQARKNRYVKIDVNEGDLKKIEFATIDGKERKIFVENDLLRIRWDRWLPSASRLLVKHKRL